MLYDAAVWAPTLLAVEGEGVRAWTGRALVLRLAWRLGPVRSARVVGGVAGSAAVWVPGRRQFLRLAPLAAVGAVALSSGLATPAAAAERSARAKADAWATANRATLPTGYDQVTAYPMVQRTAIFRALLPAARRSLWTEHFARYSAAHPQLNPSQRAVLAEAGRALEIAFEDQLSQRDHATLAGCAPARSPPSARTARSRWSPRSVRPSRDRRRWGRRRCRTTATARWRPTGATTTSTATGPVPEGDQLRNPVGLPLHREVHPVLNRTE